MRTIGAAILGLFLGLLAGILLTEIGGRIMVAAGSTTGAGAVIGLIISLLLPVCGIVGGVAGIVVERRVPHGKARE